MRGGEEPSPTGLGRQRPLSLGLDLPRASVAPTDLSHLQAPAPPDKAAPTSPRPVVAPGPPLGVADPRAARLAGPPPAAPLSRRPGTYRSSSGPSPPGRRRKRNNSVLEDCGAQFNRVRSPVFVRRRLLGRKLPKLGVGDGSPGPSSPRLSAGPMSRRAIRRALGPYAVHPTSSRQRPAPLAFDMSKASPPGAGEQRDHGLFAPC